MNFAGSLESSINGKFVFILTRIIPHFNGSAILDFCQEIQGSLLIPKASRNPFLESLPK